MTLPPLERSPDHIGTSIAPLYEQNIKDYNSALLNYTEHFAKTLPDVNVVTFDTHQWFYDILDNADQYGFTNITGYAWSSLRIVGNTDYYANQVLRVQRPRVFLVQ